MNTMKIARATQAHIFHLREQLLDRRLQCWNLCLQITCTAPLPKRENSQLMSACMRSSDLPLHMLERTCTSLNQKMQCSLVLLSRTIDLLMKAFMIIVLGLNVCLSYRSSYFSCCHVRSGLSFSWCIYYLRTLLKHFTVCKPHC